MDNSKNKILCDTQKWIKEFIIGYDICPFAKSIPKNQLKYIIEPTEDLLQILQNIKQECNNLETNHEIETSLIIYPNVSKDFELFLDDFYACEQLLEDLDLSDIFQLVVFHPKFVFDQSEPNDPANFTNRSPYPMIHILRESSVSKAVDHHPDIENVPLMNMKKLQTRSYEFWEKLRVLDKG